MDYNKLDLFNYVIFIRILCDEYYTIYYSVFTMSFNRNVRTISRWFGWKIPVTKKKDLVNHFVKLNGEKAERIWATIQGIGFETFFFIAAEVRSKAISYLTNRRNFVSDSSLTVPKLIFPHKQIYRSDFPDVCIRVDMIKGNYHTSRFFGVIPENMRYEEWIYSFVRRSLFEKVGSFSPVTAKKWAWLLSQAKHFRQVIFGEVFKSSLNKRMKSVCWRGLESLMNDEVWIEDLSQKLRLDCATSDEFVFVPIKQMSGSELKQCAIVIYKILSSLVIDDRSMPPVRCEVSQLIRMKSKLSEHSGLLFGDSGIRENILFITDSAKTTEVRLKHVPKELWAVFKRKILGQEPHKKDCLFQYNGSIFSLQEDVF